MSWIIQQLLRNSVEIRSKSDINSDEFTDLMIIERKIRDLHSEGIVSDQELSLIEYVEDGKPMVNSKQGFGKNRISLAKDFAKLCEKVAFYTGGYFTNDGYTHYMKTKYKLTDEQVEHMLEYMKSRYKNKLIRKQKKNK